MKGRETSANKLMGTILVLTQPNITKVLDCIQSNTVKYNLRHFECGKFYKYFQEERPELLYNVS